MGRSPNTDPLNVAKLAVLNAAGRLDELQANEN